MWCPVVMCMWCPVVQSDGEKWFETVSVRAADLIQCRSQTRYPRPPIILMPHSYGDRKCPCASKEDLPCESILRMSASLDASFLLQLCLSRKLQDVAREIPHIRPKFA